MNPPRTETYEMRRDEESRSSRRATNGERARVSLRIATVITGIGAVVVITWAIADQRAGFTEKIQHQAEVNLEQEAHLRNTDKEVDELKRGLEKISDKIDDVLRFQRTNRP